MSYHAHWIHKEHLFDPEEYVCSVCGEGSDRPYDECPACGSDMTGGIKYDPVFVDELEVMDIVLGDN